MFVIDFFVTLTSTTTILFLNGLITLKHFLLNVPYPQLITIIFATISAFRLLIAEVEHVKAPHMKLNRRRL